MSYSVIDRLIEQRMRLHDREIDIGTHEASIESKTKEAARINGLVEAAQKKLHQVEKLRAVLQKMDDDSEEAFKAAKVKDDEERTALSEKYTGQIDAMNKAVSDMTMREHKTASRKDAMNKQLALLESKPLGGGTQYETYVRERQKKIENVKVKHEQDVTLIPDYTEQLEKETAVLAESRAKHTDVRAKVDVYINRMSDIQRTLEESRRVYDSAKSEQERLRRSLTSLQGNQAMIMRRAEQSRDERNKLFRKVTDIEEQINTLKTQTTKLDSLRAVLESKEAPAAAEAPAAEKKHADPNEQPTEAEEKKDGEDES